ncbi:unnamed protein product [Tilletia caries]|nr:unnamed protein product [Tilletia caries]
MSTSDAAAQAAAARDETRSTRERFERLLKQELAIQSAAMSKDEMPSCTTLFDRCLSCFALFPQLNAIYRHGSFSSCEDKVDDWKACLSLRGLDPDEKYRAWIQRRAEMAARKRMSKQTTEDVWTFRFTPDGHVVDPEHESDDFPNPISTTPSAFLHGALETEAAFLRLLLKGRTVPSYSMQKSRFGHAIVPLRYQAPKLSALGRQVLPLDGRHHLSPLTP